MNTDQRQKLIPATAINVIAQLNQIIVENFRKGQPAKLILPRMFDRAFLIVHESGVVPIVDYTSER